MSALIDLVSWKCRKVTLVIIYFEFAWIAYDSIFVLQHATEGHAAAIICIRFLATALLMGVYARQTIFTSAVGVAATLIV